LTITVDVDGWAIVDAMITHPMLYKALSPYFIQTESVAMICVHSSGVETLY
jgi:hypothetical protein